MTDFFYLLDKISPGLEASRKTDFSDIFLFSINNALLYHFLANLSAHDKKMTEKSVFREVSNPEMTSQSFPVSCVWSLGFLPLPVFGTSKHGKKNRYRIFFWLSVHCGDFIEQIKIICHIHFNEILVYSLLFIRQSEFDVFRLCTKQLCIFPVNILASFANYGRQAQKMVRNNKTTL